MRGRSALWENQIMKSVGVLLVTLFMLSACGGSTTTPTSGGTSQPKTPIKIGISVSLSGDFSADGKAFQQGYQIWADSVNKSGGLLGRQVQLNFLSDASSTTQVVTNYQKFITVDHVDLVLGPYSTLLTKPSSVVANRYGYPMIEGAGGGPSIFTQGLHNLFDVSPPIANQLDAFAQYILSLPGGQRPTIAAYATEDDPFAQPMVDNARKKLEQGGVKTASYQVFPSETTDFTPIAQKIIASKAQVVVVGSFLPDVVAYVQAFKQQHYNPQAFVASAGPDEGAQFSSAVGGATSAEGIMNPSSWYPGLTTYQNAQFVQDYLAKYGGKAADISVDSAEAYAVGQVLVQAANKIQSIDHAKLITELHSGDTFKSIQGDVKFDDLGENIATPAFIFQWQKGAFIPVYPTDQAVASPEFPKPNWP